MQTAAYGSLKVQEVLDVVLITAAFDQKVSLLLLDDAVFHLKNNQQANIVGTKDISAIYRSLELYDIETIYVEHESLIERGLSQDDLLLPVILVKRSELAAILGAFDFILKPAGENPEQNLQLLRIQVENKIELFRTIKKDSTGVEAKNPHKYSEILDSKNKFSLIAIGISTGGPKALMDLLPDLSKATDLPIIIAQHMPEGFTKSLASMLDKVCGHTVVEGRDGMDIEKGNIYLAPGGFNLLLKKIDDKVHIAINKNIAQNKYSPSVDQLFRSVASIYRDELISIIMTGMGNDGTAGISTVKRLGGYIIAQDKESSIVWGMPGRAIETGHVDIVLGIKDIADHISTLCR